MRAALRLTHSRRRTAVLVTMRITVVMAGDMARLMAGCVVMAPAMVMTKTGQQMPTITRNGDRRIGGKRDSNRQAMSDEPHRVRPLTIKRSQILVG